jgi:hypothetical protein
MLSFAGMWDLLDFLFVPKRERTRLLAELVDSFKRARR